MKESARRRVFVASARSSAARASTRREPLLLGRTTTGFALGLAVLFAAEVRADELAKSGAGAPATAGSKSLKRSRRSAKSSCTGLGRGPGLASTMKARLPAQDGLDLSKLHSNPCFSLARAKRIGLMYKRLPSAVATPVGANYSGERSRA
jgi:hypothetical protein